MKKTPPVNPKKPEKKQYKDYTERDIAAAMVVLDFQNGNVNKAAKILDIPESTLRKWKKARHEKPQIAEKCEEFQGELSERFEKSIRLALTEGEKKLTGATLAQINDYVAMLTEKYQILQNKPSMIQGFASENKFELLAGIMLGASERRAAAVEKSVSQ